MNVLLFACSADWLIGIRYRGCAKTAKLRQSSSASRRFDASTNKGGQTCVAEECKVRFAAERELEFDNSRILSN
jgi:hypothetical protein